MPLSRSRDYLSIGEVLASLRAEFPDISISKIRFLEAEGLIAPERTSAGYRKFFEGDVARLRYILSLQRDHFLPLKVIRDRLAQAEGNGDVPPRAPAASSIPSQRAEEVSHAPNLEHLAAVQLNRDELRRSGGLSAEELAELEDYGVLPKRDQDGAYDENDLLVARAAKGLFDSGIQARHLRMYRQFAEREAGMFEQLVAPLAKRRRPEGDNGEGATSLTRLLSFASQLHDASLRSSVRKLL